MLVPCLKECGRTRKVIERDERLTEAMELVLCKEWLRLFILKEVHILLRVKSQLVQRRWVDNDSLLVSLMQVKWSPHKTGLLTASKPKWLLCNVQLVCGSPCHRRWMLMVYMTSESIFMNNLWKKCLSLRHKPLLHKMPELQCLWDSFLRKYHYVLLPCNDYP